MNIANTLALFWGATLLVIGLSVFNKRFILNVVQEIENSKALLWLNGFIAFILGAATLSLYSEWTSDWRVVITIVGWLCILKGIGLMVFPGTFLAIYKKFKVEPAIMVSGVIAILLGLGLLYLGFTT